MNSIEKHYREILEKFILDLTKKTNLIKETIDYTKPNIPKDDINLLVEYFVKFQAYFELMDMKLNRIVKKIERFKRLGVI